MQSQQLFSPLPVFSLNYFNLSAVQEKLFTLTNPRATQTRTSQKNFAIESRITNQSIVFFLCSPERVLCKFKNNFLCYIFQFFHTRTSSMRTSRACRPQNFPTQYLLLLNNFVHFILIKVSSACFMLCLIFALFSSEFTRPFTTKFSLRGAHDNYKLQYGNFSVVMRSWKNIRREN